MKLETRRFRTDRNSPTVKLCVLVPENETEKALLSAMLGGCGEKPLKVQGILALADGIGPPYLQIWNPEISPTMKVAEKY